MAVRTFSRRFRRIGKLRNDGQSSGQSQWKSSWRDGNVGRALINNVFRLRFRRIFGFVSIMFAEQMFVQIAKSRKRRRWTLIAFVRTLGNVSHRIIIIIIITVLSRARSIRCVTVSRSTWKNKNNPSQVKR